mgnify:CR=1 FL=1
MAGQFSQDPGSAANGGDLGWTERGQFVPEFEGAAFKLRPGEMSEPIESSFGYHLIQLIERRGDKIHTRHILLKPEVGFSELKQAEKRIDSIRNVILNDTLTFKEAVEKYSDDEETKNIGGTIYNQANGTTSFEMSELDPTVFFITDGLQEGDISEAIEFEMRDGTKAYRIIYVKSRTKPHLANLNDDYYKLQKIVEAQKQNETLVTWIQKNAPNTYIKIHDDYYSCEAVEKWVKK